MNSRIKSIIQFLIFLLIGLGLLYMLYNQLDASYQKECAFKNIPESECSLIKRILQDFASVKIFWIIVLCLVFMLSNVLRALRWNQLLEPLGYKPKLLNSVGTIMVAYLANLALPRIGEVVRAGSLSRYEKIPVSAVFGTVVVDRILDFISLFIVIGLAVALSFQSFSNYFNENFAMPKGSLILILATGAVMGLIVLYFLNRALKNTESQNKLVLKLQQIWKGFKDGLNSIRNVGNMPLLIFNSIAIWFCYYIMIPLGFLSFAPTAELGAVAGLVVFVFGSLGIVLPSPGGIGSYQWLVSQALIIYGIDKFDAFSFSNIMFFAIQIFCNILFGFFFLLFLPQYNTKTSATADAQEA